jgi:hypothetical protein
VCAECGARSKDVFRDDIIAANGPEIIAELDALTVDTYVPPPQPPPEWYDGQVRTMYFGDDGTPVDVRVAPRATRTLRKIEKMARGRLRVSRYLRMPTRRRMPSGRPAGTARVTRGPPSDDSDPEPPGLESVWLHALEELDTVDDLLELSRLALTRAGWISAWRRSQ